MTSRIELQLSGRLPQELTEVICARFGDMAQSQQRGATLLIGSVADQAALRALLGLVWDNGGSVTSVAVHTCASSTHARDPSEH